MDGLVIFSRLNTIKKFTTSLTLHARKLLLWKETLSLTPFKIITVGRPRTTLRAFLVGRLGCSTKREFWGRGYHCKPKSLNVPLLSDITPNRNLSFSISPMISNNIFAKSFQTNFTINFAIIAFRQISLKILPASHIFSHTIKIYLKNLVGIKSLNKNHCPARLSPTIIPLVSPFLSKISSPLMLVCYPHQVWTFVRNTGSLTIIPPNSQKFTHFPHQKTPLNKFISYQNCHPFPHKIAVSM